MCGHVRTVVRLPTSFSSELIPSPHLNLLTPLCLMVSPNLLIANALPSIHPTHSTLPPLHLSLPPSLNVGDQGLGRGSGPDVPRREGGADVLSRLRLRSPRSRRGHPPQCHTGFRCGASEDQLMMVYYISTHPGLPTFIIRNKQLMIKP